METKHKIENIPCTKCGREDMPLHYNRECPECFNSSPEKRAAAICNETIFCDGDEHKRARPEMKMKMKLGESNDWTLYFENGEFSLSNAYTGEVLTAYGTYENGGKFYSVDHGPNQRDVDMISEVIDLIHA